MALVRHRVTVTTDGSGAGEAFTPVTFGRISSVHYYLDGASPYAAGADFTVTVEATSQAIWSQDNVAASAVVAPRQSVHSTTGGAILAWALGDPATDYIVLGGDRIKFAVANGGAAKTGTFDVVLL